MELAVIYTRPDSDGRLDLTGLDNDGEDVHTTLWRGFLIAGGTGEPAVTGAINDKYRRDIELGFTCPNNGDLRIYYKPVNATPRPNTSNDYVQQAHRWGVRTAIA